MSVEHGGHHAEQTVESTIAAMILCFLAAPPVLEALTETGDELLGNSGHGH